MKRIGTLILTMCSLISFGQSEATASSSELQKYIALDKEETRAAFDDQVLIVVVPVKEEAKAEFDTWIKDVLYNALNKSDSEMKKAQMKTTRWLEPERQNKDGSWTYTWIMDPFIPGTNYDILPFLHDEYGEAAGNKHWAKYLTFMAAAPQSILLKQTDY